MNNVFRVQIAIVTGLWFAVFSWAQTHTTPLASSDPNAPSATSLEDFSTASLDRSQLRADPPELVERSDGPGFTRDFLNVQWRPGDNIYLYVVRPANVAKPPAVLYLYGHDSDTDRYQDDGWCTRATSGGYAAVGFVPALAGQRYHNRPMKQWFVSELQESLGKSAHDVQMVLNYLAERGDIDMNNIGMFGAEAGGTIAVLAASVDSRIKAIDLLDPWGDWPSWTAQSDVIPDEERPDYVKTEFLKKVADFDPLVVLPRLKSVRIRLIQLSEDEDATPAEAKNRMESALPAGAESRRFTSSVEFFGAVASGGRVFDWLKAQIKPAGSQDVQASTGTAPAASLEAGHVQ